MCCPLHKARQDSHHSRRPPLPPGMAAVRQHLPLLVPPSVRLSLHRLICPSFPTDPATCWSPRITHSLTAPVNVTIKALKANSAVVAWDIPEGDPVIGFAITQQEETDYIVHVQYLSMSGPSPPSEPLHFRTLKEADQQVSKSKDEVTMEEVGQTQTQLRAGELIIIVVVLIMWAGVIALFCRQYDIIKDNEPNNNKDKAKNSSECIRYNPPPAPPPPTSPHGHLKPLGQFPKNNRKPSVNIIEV
ncbi:hypothetical protein JZ751_020427 [Albula glossodonta]|uniref:Fibronectin type-III domain-containing protein n=1 Tax=Albula glossodonta TaxID=121402 RepID=A0A8T2MZF2_9TELE|nr:hypothetical protein JZ751_020427 [Albula glossodonta]